MRMVRVEMSLNPDDELPIIAIVEIDGDNASVYSVEDSVTHKTVPITDDQYDEILVEAFAQLKRQQEYDGRMPLDE
jgi:hypothetical protein